MPERVRGAGRTPGDAVPRRYGSAEGAASSIQAYHAFRDYVLAAVRTRPRDSVVLAPDATLDRPIFIPCGDRPLAVVLDAAG